MSTMTEPAGGGGFLRGGLMALMGVVTAFALFWIMQALISTPFKLDEAGKKLSIEFVRLRKDTTPQEKEREKPKRQKPEQQPPPPEMNVAQNLNPSDAVGEIVPVIDTGEVLAEATSLAAGGADRAPVPLVQVDPEYPERARQQGIEGWVEVEFTISPVGTVVDARVVGAKPPIIFDRAALNAVRRWKYNPKIKDGTPIARPGVRTVFQFDNPSRSR
jgi:protein TonB